MQRLLSLTLPRYKPIRRITRIRPILKPKRIIIPATPIKDIHRQIRQRAHCLLQRTPKVRVRLGDGGVLDGEIGGGGVVIPVVVAEGRELSGLGDFAAVAEFVLLRFEDVDFGCAAAFGDGGAGVVFAWAGAGGRSLAG